MDCIWSWAISQQGANFGNLLLEVVALLTVVIAIYQLDQWKKQDKVRREAEVAGKCLASVLRFFQAIRYITAPTIDAATDDAQEQGDNPRTYRQRQDFVHRQTTTVDDFNTFFKAMNESEVYLPDAINQKLEEIWKEWVSVKVDIGIYLNGLDSGDIRAQHHINAYNNSFGTEGRRKRERLEMEIKGLLKSIARMEKK